MKLLTNSLTLAWLVVFAGIVSASSPQLSSIMPRGVQRGNEHVLLFSGARLNDAEEVFLYDKGVVVKKLEQVNANQVKVTVEVASDCRIGEHVAQLRTKSGISEYRNFFVGAMPSVKEVEPNSSFEQPQKIEMNHTVHGIVQTEDVDYYVVSVKKGQRISVEIEGIRLSGAFWDPFIAILDKNRFELGSSDDTPLLRQDGHLSVMAPEDGDYYVMVRDSAYQGNGNCRYRLHVGNFPRPTVAYPAGGKPNSDIAVKLLGDPSGVLNHQFKVPAASSFRDGLIFQDSTGVTPSPVAFRIVDLENVFEAEPNNQRNKPNVAKFPAAINGIIESPGDRDYYQVAGKKGQVWNIECYARRIRSGVDPVINIYNAQGQRLAGNDDARGQDSFLQFTVPADGNYLIQVRDHLRRGQKDFVYRIELSTPKRSLSVGIPRVDRYSQTRQTIYVPQGGRFATLVSASRSGFGGQLVLGNNELPQGMTAKAEPMVANLNLMPVVFEAAADAPIGGKLIDFSLRHIDEKQNISGNFGNLADLVLGPPNNALFYGCRVNKLPVAVVEKLPFKIELIQPKVPIVRGGRMNLKVVVHRDEGFKQPITLQLPFRPPGIGTRNTVQIPADKSVAYYPINANGGAQIGKWPIYVLAASNVNGTAWVSSQLATLEISQPLVTVTMKRSSTEQGKPVQIYCKINKIADFEGEAEAKLFGTPNEVAVKPIKFTKDTPEITFEATTTGKSPVGKHKSVFCQITIVKNGENIVSTAGYVELQITKPVVKKKVEPKPQPKQPVAKAQPKPPAEKPLSRLEKLRLERKKNQQDKKGQME